MSLRYLLLFQRVVVVKEQFKVVDKASRHTEKQHSGFCAPTLCSMLTFEFPRPKRIKLILFIIVKGFDCAIFEFMYLKNFSRENSHSYPMGSSNGIDNQQANDCVRYCTQFLTDTLPQFRATWSTDDAHLSFGIMP